MTPQERIIAAINHREGDRIPFDLGSTLVTGINYKTYYQLRDYLNLDSKTKENPVDPIQQLAYVEDDVCDILRVDIRDIIFHNAPVKGLKTSEDEHYYFFYDSWGIGWKMPKDGGHYFDLFFSPLATAEDCRTIEKYSWPEPEYIHDWYAVSSAGLNIVGEQKRATMASGLCAGPVEMAGWLRGYQNFFEDLIYNQKLAQCLMEKIIELKLRYWNKLINTVSCRIDVIQEGDDFAGQSGLLISPDLYKKLVHPLHKKLFAHLHKISEAKIFFHSCGSVRQVIPLLIEEGVDVLNPVQVSAAQMDTSELKDEYGKDLVFWGGGIDTQYVLSRGNKSEICDEVKKRIEHLARDGGFVFATVHNIQSDVSPERFLTAWNALQEHGVYST